MRHAVSVAVLVAMLVSPAATVWAQGGGPWVPPSGPWLKEKGWQLGTFHSKTIAKPVGYYVYLPPAYQKDTQKRYPVVYWLHGLNGAPASANPVVQRLDAGIKAGTAPEMILISCTDPTKRSMWTDSMDRKVPVETVVVKDIAMLLADSIQSEG